MRDHDIEKEYLECEQRWVYFLLITAAGWFGAYTFILRGGVFCNAQTANVVLFAIALGQQRWTDALYLLIPIGAYFLGAFVSELLGKTVKRFRLLRWDTILIGVEILVIIGLGFLPQNAPDQICQIALNFIYIRHHESESATRLITHGLLILFFAIGAVIGTICCTLFGYRSIWGSALILLVIFIRLAIADRSYEKELLSRVPHGH